MMYSCIKTETTSDANYVRFSVVRQKVKATLGVSKNVGRHMCSLVIP